MVKWAQRALVKPTATPSVLPARSGLGGVLFPCVSELFLSLLTPFLVSRLRIPAAAAAPSFIIASPDVRLFAICPLLYRCMEAVR